MSNSGTLKEIAANLGLSKTTVSVGLRGRPGVSDAVRAQILAEAKRLGYTPNPAAAELMAIVRSRRNAKTGRTIAFINTIREDPTLMSRTRGLRQLFEGVEQQAADFGYQVEEFKAFKDGMTPRRLDGVLKARGIPGVIVGPRWMDEPDIAIDWSAYSSVLLGETTYGTRIHRVCNHHAQTMELALQKMAGLGYRRIGIELMQNYESTRRFEYSAGLTPAQKVVGKSVHFFMRLQGASSKQSPTGKALSNSPSSSVNAKLFDVQNLQKWVLKESLDALVSLYAYDIGQVQALKTAHDRPLGYARLETDSSEHCAGINQHGVEIGRTAMDILRELLHTGERGLKPQPRIVLVEGEWMDGPTAPKVER